MIESPRWWEARRAQNRKPASYRCPLCGEMLPALSEHMLLFPEGDHSRRRHAHTACVLRARKQGALPSREEYERRRQRGAAEAAPRAAKAAPRAARAAPRGTAPRKPVRDQPTVLRRLLARLRP